MFAIFYSGCAIDSEMHFKCLGKISSLPGAQSLSLLITSLISFMFVRSRQKDDWVFSVKKIALRYTSIGYLESKSWSNITKKLLNPFAIAIGSTVTWSFKINCLEFLVLFFFFITSLLIIHILRKFCFILYYLALIEMLWLVFRRECSLLLCCLYFDKLFKVGCFGDRR